MAPQRHKNYSFQAYPELMVVLTVYSGKASYATRLKCAEAVKAKMQEHMTCLSKEKETLSWFYLFTKTHSTFRHIVYQKQTETCNLHVALNTQWAFLLFEFSLSIQSLWCRHRNLSEVKNAKQSYFVIIYFVGCTESYDVLQKENKKN